MVITTEITRHKFNQMTPCIYSDGYTDTDGIKFFGCLQTEELDIKTLTLVNIYGIGSDSLPVLARADGCVYIPMIKKEFFIGVTSVFYLVDEYI